MGAARKNSFHQWEAMSTFSQAPLQIAVQTGNGERGVGLETRFYVARIEAGPTTGKLRFEYRESVCEGVAVTERFREPAACRTDGEDPRGHSSGHGRIRRHPASADGAPDGQ